MLKLQSSYVTVSMKEIAGASLDNSEEVNAEALQAAEQLLHRLVCCDDSLSELNFNSGSSKLRPKDSIRRAARLH